MVVILDPELRKEIDKELKAQSSPVFDLSKEIEWAWSVPIGRNKESIECVEVSRLKELKKALKEKISSSGYVSDRIIDELFGEAFKDG